MQDIRFWNLETDGRDQWRRLHCYAGYGLLDGSGGYQYAEEGLQF